MYCILSPKLSLLFCCYMCASTVFAAASENSSYSVVVSKQTYDNQQWKAVVDALGEKHNADVITYEKNVGEVLELLRKMFPRYACFVARPEEAGRDFVIAVHRMTRCLDADPYTDVVWGIITGYSADDALRIARHEKPLTVRKGAGGTPFNLNLFDEGIYFKEGSKNSYVEKKADGQIEKKTGTGDDAQPLAEVICKLKPDFFTTSGHATERDWQIGYPTGNNKGQFVCKDGWMIAVSRDGKKKFPIDSPNPKIYLPWGNCLMGHVDGKQAMALAWMHSVGVNQMFGYVVPQWNGWGGRGTFKYFFSEPGRYTFSEAFFFNNQKLVNTLETRFPKTARLAFDRLDMHKDRQLLNKMAAVLLNEDKSLREKVEAAGRKKKQSPEMKDNLGLLYDRDVLAFYGDPAWEARMASHGLPFTHKLTEKDGVYTFRITVTEDCEPRHPPAMLLPDRLKDIEVIEGAELFPLITDNFIMLMEPGKFEKGKTYDVVFKAEKIEPSAAGVNPAHMKYRMIKLPPPASGQGNSQLDKKTMERFQRLLAEHIKNKDPEVMALIKNGRLEITSEKILELLKKWDKEERPKCKQ